MKRSKQRDAILEFLCSTTSHPTADTIYDEVRKKIPNISLGTVYRNLNLLTSTGEITKIDVGFDQSHYDGKSQPHNHFVCRKCRRVYDVADEYDRSIDEKCGSDVDGTIEYHTLMFYGVCHSCEND